MHAVAGNDHGPRRPAASEGVSQFTVGAVPGTGRTVAGSAQPVDVHAAVEALRADGLLAYAVAGDDLAVAALHALIVAGALGWYVSPAQGLDRPAQAARSRLAMPPEQADVAGSAGAPVFGAVPAALAHTVAR